MQRSDRLMHGVNIAVVAGLGVLWATTSLSGRDVAVLGAGTALLAYFFGRRVDVPVPKAPERFVGEITTQFVEHLIVPLCVVLPAAPVATVVGLVDGLWLRRLSRTRRPLRFYVYGGAVYAADALACSAVGKLLVHAVPGKGGYALAVAVGVPLYLVLTWAGLAALLWAERGVLPSSIEFVTSLLVLPVPVALASALVLTYEAEEWAAAV